VALSVVLALAQAWLGIVLAYATDWPVSFWISALSVGTYLAAIVLGKRLFRRGPLEPDGAGHSHNH
jgi:zinc/manganese transport system permease protein